MQDALRSPEDCAAFIEAAIEEAADDPAFIALVLGEVAKARGMVQPARDVGMSREEKTMASCKADGAAVRHCHRSAVDCGGRADHALHQRTIPRGGDDQSC